MPAVLPLLALLLLLASGPDRPEPSPASAGDLPAVSWNDNDVAAGTLGDGRLTLDLEVRRGSWHPLGPGEPGLPVLAFAEVGRPLSIPGPLVRVPAGTEVTVRITNPMDAPLELEGFQSRSRALGLDTVTVAPGATEEVTFIADVAGTYAYRGRMEDSPTSTEPFEDNLLGGAFVVDDPAAETDDDELMVIQIFYGDELPDGEPDFAQEYLTINGRPWPHTRRLNYEMGESVRWRLVNASDDVHPMHLHGFFFEVESRGDMERDTVYWEGERRKAVTELMLPWTTMRMNWTPDRPGGWVFHCHLTFHVQANVPVEGPKRTGDELFFEMLAGDTGEGHGAHDHTATMGGLVVAIEVRTPADWQVDRPSAEKLRLHIHQDSTTGAMVPRFSAVLENVGPVPVDSTVFPGSPLILTEGPPATVRVLNHTREGTQLHWHGLELESYYDGVPGGTGHVGRRTPVIAAADSFDVVLRTTRPGTYIYHTHVSDVRQQGAGLYGPLIVVPKDEPWDPARERIVLIGEGMGEEAPLSGLVYLNGGRGETPMEFEVGREQRLRLINISLGFPMTQVVLLKDGFPVRWVPVAEDAFEIPAHRRDPVRAMRTVSMGQTFDFLYTPDAPGEMTLELRSGGGDLHVSQPIRVLPAPVADDDQIASAVQAAPPEERDGATVIGWTPEGENVVLREGTNELVCLSDDPRDTSWSVACYHESLAPYMARGRELRREGLSGEEAGARRFAEVEAGELELPAGKLLYVLSGTRWDAEAGEVVDPYLRWVVYTPYATPESTGYPLSPRSPGEPWLMDPGSVGAHVMITPERGG